MMEKPTGRQAISKSSAWMRLGLALLAVVACFSVSTTRQKWAKWEPELPTESVEVAAKCPIFDIVRPSSFHEDNSTLVKIITDPEYRSQSAAKLSGAVQVKTDTFDNSPYVEDDPEYWQEKFEPFHQYLFKTFPQLFTSIFKVETVNGWGLLLTWQGSDPSLKPVVLMAHQDVVPTQDATLDDWTYPPYDGKYDGERLWGRGSADCKNLLIGLLESAQELVNSNFKPSRTIIYSFGFDEEIGGINGAQKLAEVLRQRYGPKSFYAIIDEGGQSLIKQNDVYLALPGTSEKGSVDVNLSLKTPGGHSSVPQGDHTSIGLLASVIHDLEQHPFRGIFSSANPTFHEYQCIAVHSPTLPRKIKRDILKSSPHHSKSLFAPLSSANDRVVDFLTRDSFTTRFLISTSTAVDIVHGGTKSNALPEYVQAIVNHRVAIESSVNETVEHDLKSVWRVADKHGLGVSLNGVQLKQPSGDLDISPWSTSSFSVTYKDALDPAPATPVNDKHWDILAGVIRHVYEEVSYLGAKNASDNPFSKQPVVVAPGIATGNTDTRYYWDLSDHIYRYRPGINPTIETHAHGVDERILFDSHLQIVAFYYQYLQVIDQID